MKTRTLLLSAGLLLVGGAFILATRKSSAESAPEPASDGDSPIPAKQPIIAAPDIVKSILNLQDRVPVETTVKPTIVPQTVNTAPTAPAFQEALTLPAEAPTVAPLPSKVSTSTAIFTKPANSYTSPLTLATLRTVTSIKPTVLR